MDNFAPEQLPIQYLDYKSLLPSISRATLALGKYDFALGHTPNPKIFIASLERMEALNSNWIEGSQSSLSEVLSAEAEQGSLVEPESEIKDDLKEVFNYRKALSLAEEAIMKGAPFSLDLLRKIHHTLLDSARGQNKAPGQLRHLPSHQNWIGRLGTSQEDAIFLPPAPAQVENLMRDWEAYYHSHDSDPLVQLAVVHGQFELIHPFLDGNGRTGRLLVPLFLFEKNIISRPYFYISPFLEQNRSAYMALLGGLSQSPPQWHEWVEFFLFVIEMQANSNVEKIKAIENLYAELKIKFINATSSKYAIPALDAMFVTPIFSLRALQVGMARAGREIQASTLSYTLRNLAGKGLIRTEQAGKGRSKVTYSLDELVKILQD